MQTRTVAGRYVLTRQLGRGGMGTVWLGQDSLTGRTVAVKELRAPAGASAEDQEIFGKRALREARSAARIQHPNAVTLYDVVPASADDDAVYLIMEYVEGATLAQEIERSGTLSEKRVTAIAVQLLAVLQTAHRLGIIHRDIKPGNIMIAPDGQAKLADFGIAHSLGDTRLTSGVIGTLAYMAPEQFETRAVTAASDLWALGATLYHAAEGNGPFDRESTAAMVRAIAMDPVPVMRSDGPLATAITGMLTRDPARRFTIPQARKALGAAAEVPAQQAAGYTPTKPAGSATPAARRARDPGGRPLAELSGRILELRMPPSSLRHAEAPALSGRGNRPGIMGRNTVRFGAIPDGVRYLARWLMWISLTFFVAGMVLAFAHRWQRPDQLLVGVTIGLIILSCVGQLALNSAWPTLAIGPLGIAIANDRTTGLSLTWDEIGRIGPITVDGRTYLYTWADRINPRRPLVRLSPLGPPRFPPAEIRAAILMHHPDAVIDPM